MLRPEDAALQQRIRELAARLGQTSANSRSALLGRIIRARVYTS
jgi:hypothetical protein